MIVKSSCNLRESSFEALDPRLCADRIMMPHVTIITNQPPGILPAASDKEKKMLAKFSDTCIVTMLSTHTQQVLNLCK